MIITEKVKRHLIRLLDRIRLGLTHNNANELQNAKDLLAKLMSKYGVTEADLEPESSKSELTKIMYNPNIKYKKNPAWFGVLAQLVSVHFESNVIVFSDRLGCMLVGISANLENFGQELDYAIDRSTNTYKVICAYTSGKKPLANDYFYGFAMGFNQALIEYKHKEQDHTTDSKEAIAIIDQEDIQAIAVISLTLAKVEAEINEAKNSGKAKNTEFNHEVKDSNAFALGFLDGLNAKKKLLKK